MFNRQLTINGNHGTHETAISSAFFRSRRLMFGRKTKEIFVAFGKIRCRREPHGISHLRHREVGSICLAFCKRICRIKSTGVTPIFDFTLRNNCARLMPNLLACVVPYIVKVDTYTFFRSCKPCRQKCFIFYALSKFC